MATIKKLYFLTGVDTTAPTDLTSESSTVHIATYADDAAFVTANGAATAGDVYINSTSDKFRLYVNGAWRNVTMEADPTDPTKTWLVDLAGATTGTSATLDFNQTASRVYSFPDYAGSVVLNTGTDTDPVIGANATGNMDLGNVAGTVRIKGNLEVQGTQTIMNTSVVEVEDTNIILNNGGTDMTAEGGGITVERASTNASFVFDSSLASKWKGGLAGSEVQFADVSTAQTLTNKTISGASNTISNISLATQVTGTLPIGSGGTGQTTANAALNALLPTQTGNANKYLQTDGTNTSWQTAAGGGGPYLGDTSGSAVPAGYIGEVISSSAISATSVSSTTFVDVTGASLALTAGVWAIKWAGLLRVDQSGGGAITCQVFDNSNTFIGGVARFRSFDGGQETMTGEVIVSISSSTTYKLRIASTGATSSFETADQSVVNDAKYYFYGVRIA